MEKKCHYSLEIGSRIQFDEDTVLTIIGVRDDEVRVGIESTGTEREIAGLPLRIVIPSTR